MFTFKKHPLNKSMNFLDLWPDCDLYDAHASGLYFSYTTITLSHRLTCYLSGQNVILAHINEHILLCTDISNQIPNTYTYIYSINCKRKRGFHILEAHIIKSTNSK